MNSFVKILALLAFPVIVFNFTSTGKIKDQKAYLFNEPDGQKFGLVSPQTPIEVLQTNGAWVQVSVKGWVKRDALSIVEKEKKNTNPTVQQPVFKPCGNNILLGYDGFYDDEYFTYLTGEIVNKSGKFYQYAWFKVTFYGSAGQILQVDDVIIENLGTTASKTIKVRLKDISEYSISSYRVQFSKGL